MNRLVLPCDNRLIFRRSNKRSTWEEVGFWSQSYTRRRYIILKIQSNISVHRAL